MWFSLSFLKQKSKASKFHTHCKLSLSIYSVIKRSFYSQHDVTFVSLITNNPSRFYKHSWDFNFHPCFLPTSWYFRTFMVFFCSLGNNNEDITTHMLHTIGIRYLAISYLWRGTIFYETLPFGIWIMISFYIWN